MFFQLIAYIKFILKSTNQHGVHSPFVYNFITKGIYKPKINTQISYFKKYRKVLLKNREYITVKDFGAGSRIFNSNKRRIKDIAKVAGTSVTKATLLIKIANYFKPATILEIGTSLGLGTICFAISNPTCEIITLEGCTKTSKIAQLNLKKFNYRNISFNIGKFETTLPKIISANNSFDIIFFDGNHQLNPMLTYFNLCLKSISNNSLFIIDDIHLNQDMEKFWEQVITHKSVSVSIDLFYYGILFFRKEQPKQHFIIRP